MAEADRSSFEVLADEIIAVVEATEVGATRGDTSALAMYGAYVYGLRRFAAIRILAGIGDGHEAMILTRSLLSLVARAAYVDAPSDAAERKVRFERSEMTRLDELSKTAAALKSVGFEIDDDTAEVERELASLKHQGIKKLPNDRDLLLNEVNLAQFYARLYRPGSEHVHFSLSEAVGELRGKPEVSLRQGDVVLADEALQLAILTYAVLINVSDKSLRHGLRERIGERIREVFGGDLP